MANSRKIPANNEIINVIDNERDVPPCSVSYLSFVFG